MCLNRVVLGPEIARMPAAMPFWVDLAQGNNDDRDGDNWEGTQRFGQWLRGRNRAHKCPICRHLSPTQSAMLSLFASIFECIFLLFSTFGALASILRPKMKNTFLLALLPLVAILPETMARSVSVIQSTEMNDEMAE